MSSLKIQTPDVFAPLWQGSARYRGAWGGRGSAKSNDRAQHLIVRMLETPGTRAVCLREVQKSIKDSVHQLLSDWIDRLGVSELFEITRDEIKGPGGGLITFRGMNDQSADSIKSLEGYNVAWFEEAQTASERSLRLLRPTIRAPGSELWFTWNPRNPTDPVDRFLRRNRPDNAVVVRANYSDNPWFPAELEAERQLDQAGDEGVYRHVWLGDYEVLSDRQLISAKTVQGSQERSVERMRFDEFVMGVDVARYGDDESVICRRVGRDAKTTTWDVFRQLDTMDLAARVARIWEVEQPDALIVDEGGVGAGVVDRLRQLGVPVIAVNFGSKPVGVYDGKVANRRAEMWCRMREWLEVGAIPDDPTLEAELTSVEYLFDAQNAIQLVSKEKMKAKGLPSPDRADALALTFAVPVISRGDARHEYEDRGANPVTGY